MVKILAEFLTRIGRQRIVLDRCSQEPYLERYHVFLKDRKHFPFNIFIHKFLKSDPDDVHDHPWPYFTLILHGGYYEYVPIFDSDGKKVGENKHWRGPGHFRYSPAHSFHRIELKQDVECWTLFVPGPKRRDWGFLVNNKWIPHDDYLRTKSGRI